MFQVSNWIRHQKGLNTEGKCICLRCKVELPYTIPINQPVCSKMDMLYLGDIPEAKECTVSPK